MCTKSCPSERTDDCLFLVYCPLVRHLPRLPLPVPPPGVVQGSQTEGVRSTRQRKEVIVTTAAC
jgi:hypothetical protein